MKGSKEVGSERCAKIKTILFKIFTVSYDTTEFIFFNSVLYYFLKNTMGFCWIQAIVSSVIVTGCTHLDFVCLSKIYNEN